MTDESEQDRLSRECRELYAELIERGAIDGTYEEWLKHATERATGRLNGHEEPPRIVTLQ